MESLADAISSADADCSWEAAETLSISVETFELLAEIRLERSLIVFVSLVTASKSLDISFARSVTSLEASWR